MTFDARSVRTTSGATAKSSDTIIYVSIALIFYRGESIRLVGVHIVVHTAKEHTEDKNRDKDIEHNRKVDKHWQLNTDSHREEEHAILDDEETYKMGKYSLTQHDKDKSREQGV